MKTVKRSQGTVVTREEEKKRKQYLWTKATSIHLCRTFGLGSKDIKKSLTLRSWKVKGAGIPGEKGKKYCNRVMEKLLRDKGKGF